MTSGFVLTLKSLNTMHDKNSDISLATLSAEGAYNGVDQGVSLWKMSRATDHQGLDSMGL